MALQWNDSLSVGVGIIDTQHQKLIKMINELGDAMKNGQGKEALGKIIQGLAAYTVEHFKTEERYFDQFGYPETAAHKKEHADFVKKVSEFKADFDSGKSTLTIGVLSFLNDWLIKHIKGSDKKYTALFQQKGLK